MKYHKTIKVINAHDETTRQFFKLVDETGMTHTELADKSGIGPGTISSWRSGKHTARLDLFAALVEAGGCELTIKRKE
jgi:transcriptional regulator with XRE-family HTH domain